MSIILNLMMQPYFSFRFAFCVFPCPLFVLGGGTSDQGVLEGIHMQEPGNPTVADFGKSSFMDRDRGVQYIEVLENSI